VSVRVSEYGRWPPRNQFDAPKRLAYHWRLVEFRVKPKALSCAELSVARGEVLAATQSRLLDDLLAAFHVQKRDGAMQVADDRAGRTDWPTGTRDASV
jgi:hypothetical protein